jgi:uncharacterized hydrophobic protein (TIGR00271 family)
MDNGHQSAGGTLFRRMRLRATPEQMGAIYSSVLDSSHLDTEYAALLILAGLIALFGLLENSAAVIIGAMLISPLMNPILSAALALLLGDGNLGKRSVSVLGISIAAVIGVTWLVASLTPLKQATPEVFARTSPNLLDLFIAFLSGLAGTLALRGGSVTLTILPGVAIAVAVVPPLAVVGYGLSTHQGGIAGGAFLLFVTNLVSIIISAALVFRIFGFRPHRETEQGRWKLKYRVGLSALVLLVLSVPLFLTLRRAAIEVATRSQVRQELETAFQSEHASISDLGFSRLRNGLVIQATIRTTRYVETEAIQAIEKSLRQEFGPGTNLLIDQILVTQGGVSAPRPASAQNPISGGVIKPVEAKPAFNFNESTAKTLDFAQNGLDAILAGTPIRREAASELVLTASPPLVLKVQLASPQPLGSQAITLLDSQLGSKLGMQVQLGGQVEILDPGFRLSLTPKSAASGLSAAEWKAVNALAKLVQQQDLRLQIAYSPALAGSAGRQLPRFLSELRSLLVRSPLNKSHWTMAAAPPGAPAPAAPANPPVPPPESELKSATSGAPAQLRCELKVFQDF